MNARNTMTWVDDRLEGSPIQMAAILVCGTDSAAQVWGHVGLCATQATAATIIAATGKAPKIGLKNREVKPWLRGISAVNALLLGFVILLDAVELRRRSIAAADDKS